MVKTFKNLLLRNQTAYYLETWYVASSAQVLPSLFKWWPWVGLDIFYGKAKFGPLWFCMGKKGKAMDFSETFVLYDIKVGKCSYVNEFMIETWYVALGAQVLPSLFKWWPWVDPDLFYGKVKFGPLWLCMGKR